MVKIRTDPAVNDQVPSKSARRVLIVDDDQDSATLLAVLLRKLGYEATPVIGGREALAAAKDSPPEVAVLDLNLPGMNGFELAMRLRKAAANPNLRLVALTGYSGDEIQERCRQAGFDAHLVKGVDLDELLATLGPSTASPSAV